MLVPRPASSCFFAIRSCSASYSSPGVGSLCSFDGSAASASRVGSVPAAFLNSAALPKENARRSREVLLLDFRLIAARCFAAGLSALGRGAAEVVGLGFWVEDPVFCTASSPAIVAGRDRGDGLRVLFPASGDGRSPWFTDFAWSWLEAWLVLDWLEAGRGEGVLRFADWWEKTLC